MAGVQGSGWVVCGALRFTVASLTLSLSCLGHLRSRKAPELLQSLTFSGDAAAREGGEVAARGDQAWLWVLLRGPSTPFLVPLGGVTMGVGQVPEVWSPAGGALLSGLQSALRPRFPTRLLPGPPQAPGLCLQEDQTLPQASLSGGGHGLAAGCCLQHAQVPGLWDERPGLGARSSGTLLVTTPRPGSEAQVARHTLWGCRGGAFLPRPAPGGSSAPGSGSASVFRWHLPRLCVLAPLLFL